MSAPPLLARLEAIPARAVSDSDVARVVELVAASAFDAADELMLRQLLGVQPTPRRVHRKRNRAKHGTAQGLAWHAEYQVPDCQPCRRWRYAHDVHGTPQACQAHYHDGIALCAECQSFYNRAHRRLNQPSGHSCGSPAGYKRHLRLGERVCASCRQAEGRRSTKRHGIGTDRLDKLLKVQATTTNQLDGIDGGVQAHAGGSLRVGEADLAR